MFIEYKSLSDEELDEKIGEVTKKINTAYAMGLDSAVDQLQDILENLRMELT